MRDRQLVAERMRKHVASADSTPLLIFPEVWPGIWRTTRRACFQTKMLLPAGHSNAVRM